MKKILSATAILSLALYASTLAAASQPQPKANGTIFMGSPSQQMIFSAFGTGDPATSKGTVEYWNYEYPGGLHFVANVLCANVDQENHKASFVFQIPEGFPGLSGLYVVSHVYDGGSSGVGNDTYGHTVVSGVTPGCSSDVAVSNYPVTAGNLTVH